MVAVKPLCSFFGLVSRLFSFHHWRPSACPSCHFLARENESTPAGALHEKMILARTANFVVYILNYLQMFSRS